MPGRSPRWRSWASSAQRRHRGWWYSSTGVHPTPACPARSLRRAGRCPCTPLGSSADGSASCRRRVTTPLDRSESSCPSGGRGSSIPTFHVERGMRRATRSARSRDCSARTTEESASSTESGTTGGLHQLRSLRPQPRRRSGHPVGRRRWRPTGGCHRRTSGTRTPTTPDRGRSRMPVAPMTTALFGCCSAHVDGRTRSGRSAPSRRGVARASHRGPGPAGVSACTGVSRRGTVRGSSAGTPFGSISGRIAPAGRSACGDAGGWELRGAADRSPARPPAVAGGRQQSTGSSAASRPGVRGPTRSAGPLTPVAGGPPAWRARWFPADGRGGPVRTREGVGPRTARSRGRMRISRARGGAQLAASASRS